MAKTHCINKENKCMKYNSMAKATRPLHISESGINKIEKE
jgi:hypothetical protein